MPDGTNRRSVGQRPGTKETFSERRSMEELQEQVRGLQLRQAALEKENADLRARLSQAESAAKGSDQARLPEDRLKQSNDYLENIFENSPDAIGIVDRHGKLIKWNKMACELYGYTFEELRGKSSFDLYADQDQLDRMLTLLRLAGTVKRYEINMKRKDGTIAPSRVSLSLLRDESNRVIGSICVARDFTPVMKAISRVQKEMWLRRETEAALRQSESLNLENERKRRVLAREFQLFLDAIPDGLVLLTPELKIYWANRSFAAGCGRDDDAAALVGEYCYSAWLKRTGPCVGCPALRAFQEGRPTSGCITTPEGRSCEVRAVPVKDEDGTVLYAIDITRNNTVQDG